MGVLPEFSLPSNSNVKIRMHEATVSDSIDFSDVDEDREERATTLFLERVQEKESYFDPRKWTASDRRFALFWYFLHTSEDLETPLTYDCRHCGKEHTALVDMRKVAEAYKSLNGKPERDILFDGVPIIVKPLLGEDMEELEGMRLSRDMAAEEHGLKSGEVNKLHTKLKLLSFLRTILLEGKDKTATEEWLEKLPASAFKKLYGRVGEALSDIEHGLPMALRDYQVVLLTHPLQCVNKKEDKDATTRLTFPFIAFDYIPRI